MIFDIYDNGLSCDVLDEAVVVFPGPLVACSVLTQKDEGLSSRPDGPAMYDNLEK